MSLLSRVKPKGPSGFGYGSTAEDVTAGLDLTGKNILVTGVNSGLGLESARVLALRRATVWGLARTLAKAEEVTRTLGRGAQPIACELSEPSSIRAAVDAIRARDVRLDVLLLNAGIMALPERTVHHGQELQFLTNHVGHFMLTAGLRDLLTDDARVVVVSSAAHAWAPKEGIAFDDLTLATRYTPRRAYGQSKVANILFARALARRFRGTARTANALHPGVIPTNLNRHMSLAFRIAKPLVQRITLKTIPQGAATQCYVATHPMLAATSGAYFADCNVTEPSRVAQDDALAERLWDVTEQIVSAF